MAQNTIVINVDLRETRVALIEEGIIAELQIERASHRGTVGNIVLGRVTRVLPGMQAAFIDVGQERAAFLHVEDLIRPQDFEAYVESGFNPDDKESFKGDGTRRGLAPNAAPGATGSSPQASEEALADDDAQSAADESDDELLAAPVNVTGDDEGEEDDEETDPGVAERRSAEMRAAFVTGSSSDEETGESGDDTEIGEDADEDDEAVSESVDDDGEDAPDSDDDAAADESSGEGEAASEDSSEEDAGEEVAAVATSASAPAGEAADSSGDSRRGRRGRRRRRGRGRGGLERDRSPRKAGHEGGVRRAPQLRVTRSVPITEVVKEGDEVIVQISKEPIGTKGARVTSHVSLPGRYVVYLPTVEHVGISKRIGSAKERGRLRQVIDAMKPTKGGLIVRTVAEGLTKKQLKNDIGYLIKLWSEVLKRREKARARDVLYSDLDLVLRIARDLFTDEVQKVVIDDREQYGRLVRFVEMFMPNRVKDIELYQGDEPIFDAFGLEDEIARALSRKVPLPSGGSLIVDQAEALTAIDVNTGRYVGKGSRDLEETALKTNLEAVEEIAYQLRFRNIGGLVILDLIDMEKPGNREKVWRALEQALAKDKAKTTINRISDLGLIEMTRKRTRESLGRMLHEPCFYCDGTGQIQSRETVAHEILRQVRRERINLPGYSIVVNAHPAIVDFLKSEAKEAVKLAEQRFARKLDFIPRQEYHIEQYDLQGR
jgi:ribonuclease G